MYQEGDNVRQTDTTWKNARQQHPPQTKTPSQNSSALPIQDIRNSSTLHIQNHPPQTAPPPKTKRELAGTLLNN